MNSSRTWAMSAAFGLVLAACSYAQQTPPPAVSSTPKVQTDYTPSAPGATAAGPTTPASPNSADATGIGTQTDATTASGLSQPTGTATTAAPSGAGAFPPPTGERAAVGFEHFNSSANANLAVADGRRAELGVWLVESEGPGVQIRRITEGSAADMAGLQSGDVILQINGRGATSPHGIAQMIREMPAGEIAVIEYWRNGQSSEVEIALQPSRERHEVAFRGGASSMDAEMNFGRAGSDLESRTVRLEEQLTLVLQELRQLREEMAHLRTSGSSAAAFGSTELGATPTTTGTATGVEAAPAVGSATTPAAATAPAAAAAEATETDAFADPAAPAAAPTPPPAATPAEPADAPATEPATESDDLFGSDADDSAATAEDAPAAEPAASDADSDSAETDDTTTSDAETPAAEETTEDSDDLFN